MGKSVPKLTIILTSHRKPKYLKEAIDSVLAQTRKDFTLLIVDSGKGGKEMKKVLDNLDPKIEVRFTGETAELKKKIWVCSWVLNQALKTIRTKYVSFLCDDDLIYPRYVEKMLGMLGGRKKAVYCSENRNIIRGGKDIPYGFNYAGEIKSSDFNNKVDYLQVMFKTKLLNKLSQPWFSESLDDKNHADGIFLDRLGAITKFYPVKESLCENRVTPISVTTGYITKLKI